MKKRDKGSLGKRTTGSQTRSRVKQRSAKKPAARTSQRRLTPDKQGSLNPSAGSGPSQTIVGVGASAGGLEAFRDLLHALPKDTGMAFVLVQHLEPKHESILTKLLATATEMPVQEILDGMRVKPNHVYVIPANADLSLVDGTLRVVKRRAPAGLHLPIDRFFRSLAETEESRAIGVILSGTASDGTAGLKAIKSAGGITFAQSPESARFDGMPRSAIAAGCIDLVLPPERIAAEIARIGRHPFIGLALSAITEGLPDLPAKERDWERLFRLLRTASGVDFTFYKKSTIKRRLARRMALHKLDDMSAYLRFLEGNHKELDALYREILIHVTGFFREPQVFAALKKVIVPRILAASPARDSVRIWVPGCSSGEEAYSIAICLLEVLGDRAAHTKIQIFATDVSEDAINKARAGVYPWQELRDVSPRRRRRFFKKINEHYEISPVIREVCIFARQDVTKDPPFSKLDLISCRNVLIYFEPILQKKVLSSLHYALKSSGVLLLGKSESLGGFTDLFTVLDRKNKFFTKNMLATAPIEPAQTIFQPLPQARQPGQSPPALDFEKEADRVVWERYAHAGLVVTKDLQILNFRGDTSSYLRPAPGKASFDLLRMVREELVYELRAAVRKASKSGISVRAEDIEIRHDGQTRKVNVEVRPLLAAGGRERCFLILFEEARAADERPLAPDPGKPKDRKERTRELLKLRNELARSREYVQAVIREQESTNEELKTANEEALSSMEELQSTNEELETAKEELQSSNEELISLNEQLQNRNAELSRMTDDLNNVFTGTDIPFLILDGNQRIKRFTSPAQKLLGLLPGDVGRPIGNLKIGFNIPDLEESISRVIQSARDERREVRAENGRWYMLRTRPFRIGENTIEGAVITFVDIDNLKGIHEELQKERALMTSVFDAARDLLVVILDHEGRIVQFNRTCQRLTGYSLEEASGRRVWDFLLPPEEIERVKAVFNGLLGGEPNQCETHWITKDGRRLLIGWSNSAVLNKSGFAEAVIGTGVDCTGREDAERKAKEGEATIHTLLDTASQAIMAVNRQGRIVLANRTTEPMFGYATRELIGQPVEKLVPKHLSKRHIALREEWFLHPRNTLMGAKRELAAVRKDGREFPVEISLSHLHHGEEMLAVIFVSDITERKKNEEALLDYQKQLQRLAAGMISSQESENRELARELHDVFSQELASLSLEISDLLKSSEIAKPLTERLAELGDKIKHLADNMHHTARHLHPAILDELGLIAALREECATFERELGIPVSFVPDNVPHRLPKDVPLSLYRIAQESLHNVRKHSGATVVRVSLTGGEGSIKLLVEDTGDGFDVDKARKRGGMGLISMEERARLVNGKFTIDSKPGVGTMVGVSVPLNRK